MDRINRNYYKEILEFKKEKKKKKENTQIQNNSKTEKISVRRECAQNNGMQMFVSFPKSIVTYFVVNFETL